MTTLDIIAGRFGVSAEKAKKASVELGKELRIGTGAAADSIQNLLKSGLNLDQATDLLKRFTNEAITGKSPTISLSQAVQNLSFAYATNNSALGNLSGISENFMNITEKGREALIKEGKAAAEITDEMAKFRGMIDLTNLTMGSSERFTGTLIDKQAVLGQRITELKIAIGEQLNPVLAEFIDFISTSGIIDMLGDVANRFFEWIKALEPVGQWILNNKELVMTFLTGLALGITAVITLAPILVIAMNPFIALFTAITVAVGLLYTAWNTNFLGIKETTLKQANAIKWVIDTIIIPAIKFLYETFNENFNKIRGILDGIIGFLSGWGRQLVDRLVGPFSEAWGRISDFVNKIKDALDFTKRHSPSVVDIVNRGVDQVNNALSGLALNANVSPTTIAGAVATGGSNTNVNNITVDMAGAYIGNEFAASEIGEKIGDAIIKKLQFNVRF
jgi:hypothetical protein